MHIHTIMLAVTLLVLLTGSQFFAELSREPGAVPVWLAGSSRNAP